MTTTSPTPPATGTGPDAPRRSRLGHWGSAVTTYYLLTGATTLLVGFGLVMVLSSSSVVSLAKDDSPYAVFIQQAQNAIVGTVALLIASRLSVQLYKRIAWVALIASAGLQMLVFTPLGLGDGGNRNWLKIGPVIMQPSEVVKLALAIWLGVVLARKRHLLREWAHAVIPAVPVAVFAIGTVLVGHDLGTALVLCFIVAGAMFVAGVPMRIFALGALVAGGAVATLVALSPNRVGRIFAWLGDNCDGQGACYQTKHGIWALGSGGVGGLGLGASREKWSYLPAAHNDFIYAIIGEELGLVGTILVLVLFGALAFAVVRLVTTHPDPFVQITSGAIGAWVIGQAFANIAVVIGLAPVIGLPLPLVSAGGSALIMTMAAMGVLLAFARSEPGAAEALAARPSVVRRSLAVVSRPRRDRSTPEGRPRA